MAIRANKPQGGYSVPIRPGDIGHLKREEAEMQPDVNYDTRELGPGYSLQGDQIWSQKQQRIDEAERRAAFAGRTRMPGNRPPTMQVADPRMLLAMRLLSARPDSLPPEALGGGVPVDQFNAPQMMYPQAAAPMTPEASGGVPVNAMPLPPGPYPDYTGIPSTTPNLPSNRPPKKRRVT